MGSSPIATPVIQQHLHLSTDEKAAQVSLRGLVMSLGPVAKQLGYFIWRLS
jgi:hypothetical protein